MAAITLDGTTVHTIGELPAIGSTARDFSAVKKDLSDIQLKQYLGKKIILNIFPSVDTSTCATAMRKFNEIASKLPNVLILCISADLPFAQKRFCAAEHLENVQPVSIFRHPAFGKDYGVIIVDGPVTGLLARAVVMIDEDGKIMYTQLVNDLSAEPNYSPVLDLLKKNS